MLSGITGGCVTKDGSADDGDTDDHTADSNGVDITALLVCCWCFDCRERLVTH